MFRLHLGVFIAGNLALNAANWAQGGWWWAFWPLVIWGVALTVHYLVYKTRTVDAAWVEERTEDLRSKSYDRAHIDNIESRFKDQP